MALRLITCSPRRTALLPPSRPEKQLPPGALTPAPRRQDHTSSPYALMPFAIGTASVHRDPPHDRGDHDTPLWSGRDGCYVALIWPSDKAKYFLFRGLTRFPKIGNDLPGRAVLLIMLEFFSSFRDAPLGAGLRCAIAQRGIHTHDRGYGF